MSLIDGIAFLPSIIGIVLLFFDPGDPSKKTTRLRATCIGLFLVQGAVTIFRDHSEARRHAAEAKRQDTKSGELQDSMNILLAIEHQRQAGIYGVPESIAARASVAELAQRDRASAARDSLLSISRQRQSALPRITVEYFPKEVNRHLVTRALNEARFDVRIAKPVNDLLTNAIWVGDKVALLDAQLVALTLMRAGVRLRSIRRFQHGGGSNARLVQVGADPARVAWPVLSAEDVLAMTEVVR